MDTHSYLIRYGVMSHVGRFSASPVRDTVLERGQAVVIKTDRGVELGEVLIVLDAGRENETSSLSPESPQVLRVAASEDLSRSRDAEESRPDRFALCQRMLREGNWPWELVDVEPLLDGRATVIHYLGPHQLDFAPLRARFRVECDFDVILQPIGNDVEGELSDPTAQDDDAGGGCGSCDCGAGGCGSKSTPRHEIHHHDSESKGSGCATKAHSGCSSCGISRLIADRAGIKA